MPQQSKLAKMIQLFEKELIAMANSYEKRLEHHKSDFISEGTTYTKKYLIVFYLNDQDQPVYMISKQSHDRKMARIGQYVSMFQANTLEEFDKFFNETFPSSN